MSEEENHIEIKPNNCKGCGVCVAACPKECIALGEEINIMGYKYAQFGEGLCFLRVPPGCQLRPADTGWFADFAHLAGPRDGRVDYGEGADRFTPTRRAPTPRG